MKYIIVLLFSIGLSAQDFDFNCITWSEIYPEITDIKNTSQYVEAMRSWANKYNYNWTDQEIVIEIVDWLNGSNPGRAQGCNNENIRRIYISNAFWNLNSSIDIGFRVQVIFHELGHEIMRLPHRSYNIPFNFMRNNGLNFSAQNPNNHLIALNYLFTNIDKSFTCSNDDN